MTRRGDFVFDDEMQAFVCVWCGHGHVVSAPPDRCDRCPEIANRVKASLQSNGAKK